MPYCPDCGAESRIDDVYCRNCGYNLQRDPENYRDESSDEPRDSWSSGESRDSWSSDERDDRGGGWDDQSRRRDTRDDYSRQREPRDQYDEPGRRDRPRGKRIEDGKLSYGFGFPTSNGFGALGLGSVCTFLSFLIIPAIILLGYAYRLTEAATYGDRLQPAFADLGDLLWKGGGYLVLYILLTIITYAVGFIFLGSTFFAVEQQPEFAGISGVMYFVTTLVISYVTPAVFVLYAATGSLIGALSPGRVVGFAFTGHYLVAYLVYFIISFLLFFVGIFIGILLFLTIVGPFIFFPVFFTFYLYFIAAYWGGAYYEAAEKGLVPHPSEYDADPTDEYAPDPGY